MQMSGVHGHTVMSPVASLRRAPHVDPYVAQQQQQQQQHQNAYDGSIGGESRQGSVVEIERVHELVASGQEKDAIIGHLKTRCDELHSTNGQLRQEVAQRLNASDASLQGEHSRLSLENERLRVQLDHSNKETQRVSRLAEVRAKELASMTLQKMKAEKQLGVIGAETNALQSKLSMTVENTNQQARSLAAEKGTLRDAMQVMKDTNSVLQAKQLSKDRELGILKESNAALTEQMNELRSELAASEAAKMEAVFKLTTMENERANRIQEAVSKAESRINELTKQLEGASTVHHTTLSAANTQIEELSQRVLRLEVECEELRHERDTSVREMQNAKNEGKYHSTKVRLLEEALQKKAQEAEDLRNQIFESSNRVSAENLASEQVRRQLEEEMARKRTADEEIARLRQVIDDHAQQILRKSSELDEANIERDNAKSETSAIKTNLAERDRRIMELETALTDQRQERVSIRTKADELNFSMQELQSALESEKQHRNAEKEMHKKELASSEETSRRKSDHAVMLKQREIDALEERLRTSNDRWEFQLLEAREEHIAKCKSLEDELLTVKEQAANLQQEKKSLEERHAKATSESEAMRERVNEIERQHRSQESMAGTHRKELVEAQEALETERYERELDNQRKQHEYDMLKTKSETDVRELQNRVAALQDQLEHGVDVSATQTVLLQSYVEDCESMGRRVLEEAEHDVLIDILHAGSLLNALSSKTEAADVAIRRRGLLKSEVSRLEGELTIGSEAKQSATHAALLEGIWATYTKSVSSRAHLRRLLNSPAWRELMQRKMVDDEVGNGMCDVAENFQWIHDRLHGIIATHFTDDERRHFGTSPDFFSPDKGGATFASFTLWRKTREETSPTRHRDVQSPTRNRGLHSASSSSALKPRTPTSPRWRL